MTKPRHPLSDFVHQVIRTGMPGVDRCNFATLLTLVGYEHYPTRSRRMVRGYWQDLMNCLIEHESDRFELVKVDGETLYSLVWPDEHIKPSPPEWPAEEMRTRAGRTVTVRCIPVDTQGNPLPAPGADDRGDWF